MASHALANGELIKTGAVEFERGEERSKKELCHRCKDLDLSADKFIIHDDLSVLAARARRSNSFHLPKSMNRSYLIGCLEEILKEVKTCSLCSLVARSLLDSSMIAYGEKTWENSSISDLESKFKKHLRAECHANWEVDGRSSTSPRSAKGLTRRIHLRWHDERLKDSPLIPEKGPRDSYLVFVAPEKYLRFNADGPNVWEKEALFLGRRIIEDEYSHVKMKSWLDLCRGRHDGKCANDCDQEFEDMINQSYFGVIDVLDMCLKPLPYVLEVTKDQYGIMGEPRRVPASYVALSYVWGAKDRLTTKISNVMVHQRKGGLAIDSDELPTTIKDAMRLVRLIGQRYIWIDSLCIVQDSNRSWRLNSNVMNLIYGNAILTICAADGDDAWSGLKAMHVGERLQDIEECSPGVSLMVAHLPETDIKASAWDKRAWTFQERLLSKRCLVFNEGRVFFQCRSTSMSEDIVAEPEGAGWSLDLVEAPHVMLRELMSRPIWVYMKCVLLYSNRILSKPKDILAAFNGVSNLISKTIEAPFIFGLPSSHFDLALLWEPAQALERRQVDGNEFPSWSWCGWMGAKMEYTSSMIDGCLINPHEWLRDHTWISWFIRDGHGNLRPLWDGDKSAMDRKAEKRWRGYKSRSQNIRTWDYNDDRPSFEQSDSLAVVRGTDGYETKATRACDDYGRQLSHEMSKLRRDKFCNTLPENPYRVVMAEYIFEPKQDFPDQPILQFWTWSASLRLLPSRRQYRNVGRGLFEAPYIQGPHRNVGEGLCRYDIADETGDWCGSIVLNEKWIEGKKTEASKRGWEDPKHEFIAISEAKSFTEDECEMWNYYIPKDRDQSEWDLYYVLLVERVPPPPEEEHLLARKRSQHPNIGWQRVALGKVFKLSFENTFPAKQWKEVILR